jgi:hypothetical protein
LILVECRLKTRAPNVEIITVSVIGKTYIEENWGVEVCGQPKGQPRIWALIRKTGQCVRRIIFTRVQELLKLTDICSLYSVQRKITLNSVLFIVKKH